MPKISAHARAEVYKRWNEGFPQALQKAFKERFSLGLTTRFSLMAMAMVSQRDDLTDFTPEQASFVKTYEDGYTAALNAITGEGNDA